MHIHVDTKTDSMYAEVRESVHLHIRAEDQGSSATMYKRLSPTDARQIAVQLCAAADIAEKEANRA